MAKEDFRGASHQDQALLQLQLDKTVHNAKAEEVAGAILVETVHIPRNELVKLLQASIMVGVSALDERAARVRARSQALIAKHYDAERDIAAYIYRLRKGNDRTHLEETAT